MSDRTWYIGRSYQILADMFNSKARAKRWLHQQNRYLKGQSAVEYLDGDPNTPERARKLFEYIVGVMQ